MNYEQLNDAQLWQLIASGDRGAFGHSFKLYSKEIFKYGQKFTGSREIIEDAIQDVYLDLWAKRKTTQINDSIKFYLFTAFRRVIIRRLSSLRKEANKETPVSEVQLEPSYLEQLVKKQGFRESNKALHQAIDQLTERQREAVYLRYFTDLQYEEIAQLMEVQIPHVYNLIFKSIKTLKKSLSKQLYSANH